MTTHVTHDSPVFIVYGVSSEVCAKVDRENDKSHFPCYGTGKMVPEAIMQRIIKPLIASRPNTQCAGRDYTCYTALFFSHSDDCTGD